jgi:hypothetical protein
VSKKRLIITLFAMALVFPLLFAGTSTALACGGFFCQNSAVDQNAERIIFTQNKDGTVSALIQIQYTGSAPDFSWILPLPNAIDAEDVEVPEDAMAAFNELETATVPVYIPPALPESCEVLMFSADDAGAVPMAEAEESVEVFASGEVGPFGFDVVGSEDPMAMIFWLRDHSYQVTEAMEPLIDVYVREQFVFLAMRLLPESEASDVQPVKITYRGDAPMIPLRLTAVAATPDMRVLTWFYADKQAVPVNFAHMEIPDEDIQFFLFGGNNYRQLIGDKANEFGGQAFVTEYAAPSRELAVVHPLLQELANDYAYVTRLSTVISPEEMTVDPVFGYDPQLRDVSNVHDLSNMAGVWDCDEESNNDSTVNIPIFTTGDDEGAAPGDATSSTGLGLGLLIGCLGAFLVAGILAIGVVVGRRSGSET